MARLCRLVGGFRYLSRRFSSRGDPMVCPGLGFWFIQRALNLHGWSVCVPVWGFPSMYLVGVFSGNGPFVSPSLGFRSFSKRFSSGHGSFVSLSGGFR